MSREECLWPVFECLMATRMDSARSSIARSVSDILGQRYRMPCDSLIIFSRDQPNAGWKPYSLAYCLQMSRFVAVICQFALPQYCCSSSSLHIFRCHPRFLSPPMAVQTVSAALHLLSVLRLMWPAHVHFLFLIISIADLIIKSRSRQRIKLTHFFATNIRSHCITPSDTVRNLGVSFDSDFHFRKHVSLTCRSGFYHIRDFRRIRRYVYRLVAKTIATAVLTSRLD